MRADAAAGGFPAVRPQSSPAPALRWGRALRLALAAAVATVLTVGAGPEVQAHESDQYTLPAGRDFADLGPLFSRAFHAAIRDAVARTNAEIDSALAAGDPLGQVQTLLSAGHVAGQVWGQIFAAYPTNELLDLGLLSPATRASFPGLVTMYRPVESIYDDPLLVLDVSKVVRTFFRAGTVSVGGMLIGTDKIIHFIYVGGIYHQRYLSAVARGLGEAEATKHAVTVTLANPLTSEDGMLGRYTTGIRSNGDLAANFAGLKFFRNLTEPVYVGAVLLPPMLQLDGKHWRVVVQDEDTVFTRFVTPHWNEVLNPNSYVRYVGDRVRGIVASRCDDVADWYRGGDGQPLGPAWFAARQRELATFYGEPYGHKLPAEHAVSVADICRDGHPRGGSAAEDAVLWWGGALPVAQVDSLERGALWQAAAAGRVEEVERRAARGDPLDAADIDGETALHAALLRGHLRTAALLVALGADVNRTTLHGATPLLLAVAGGHAELAEALLRAGANPNAQDQFGRTALHEAARRGDLAVARLLLRHGADATLATRYGMDALQVARRTGHDELVPALRASVPVMPQRGQAASGSAALALLPETSSGLEPVLSFPSH